MKRLPTFTAKQSAFIHWYCSAEVNMNGTEAARRAGYKGKDATLRSVASENLTKPNIRKEITKQIDAALLGADVTVEKVLQDLQVIMAKARADGRYSAAVRCVELQGKYLKMFTDKVEHDQTIDKVSTGELVQLIRELAESGGVDLGQLIAESQAKIN